VPEKLTHPPPASVQLPPAQILNHGHAEPFEVTDTQSRDGRAEASVETAMSRLVPRLKSVDTLCANPILNAAIARVVVVVGAVVVVVVVVVVVGATVVFVITVLDAGAVVEVALGVVVVVGPMPAGVALPVAIGDEEDLVLSN